MDDGEDRLEASSRLYFAVLDMWNRRSAADFAALFAEDGNMVGFDGSQVNGRSAVATHLGEIFASHPTPGYIGKVEELRALAENVVLVRAIAGLVPPGQGDIVPALNAIQTLVAARSEEGWAVELFHNTPAQFHGRPQLAEALTETLRNALRASKLGA
ncbi:MAG: SgcJ/EcaC family oxidoreductase [Tepidiformaceae bacterium]